MRKVLLIFFICCFFLPVLGCADEYSLASLKEIYSGQRWQADYETARNETVHVDVGIYLPEADEIDVLDSEYHKAVEGLRVDRIAKNDYKVMGEEYYHTDTGWFSIGWPDYDTYLQLRKEAEKAGLQGNPDVDYAGITLPYGTFDLNTAYGINNEKTVQDGWNLIQEYAERYFPGENIQLSPHWVRAVTEAGKYRRDNKLPGGYEKVKDYPDYRGVFFVDFDQVINGVPIVAAVPYGEGAGYSGGINFFPSYPDLMEYHMHFILLKVTRTVSENVSLCDPNIILQSAGQLIAEGRLRKVYSFRLGYAARKNDDGSFRLIPAWTIEGELFKDANTGYEIEPTLLSPHPIEESTLIFDARTGELIECDGKFEFF